MIQNLKHDLKVDTDRNEKARQEFVSSLRSHILNDLAADMRQRYEKHIEPHFAREQGCKPKDGREVHGAIKDDDSFKFYSSIRYNAQEMVWRSVIPAIERNLDQLIDKAKRLGGDKTLSQGSLQLDPDLEVPSNVTEIDVHLAPGSYHSEYRDDDVAAGAIYDNGLNVFAFNQMGENLNDIGASMSNYVRLKYPDFQPQQILDCGCTIGHNSLDWAKAFPKAEVHAVDVSAPVLRYAHARAQSQGVAVHFSQQNATRLRFEDNSFDVVFSSMFLHELPLKDIRAYLKEAHRVLRPGGLLLNMELPPNNEMTPYDSFYLDWDSYYNNEPFYKAFRDQDYQKLCVDGGFESDRYEQFVMPQYTYMNPGEFEQAIKATGKFDENTGRLAAGVQWFGFGAWK